MNTTIRWDRIDKVCKRIQKRSTEFSMAHWFSLRTGDSMTSLPLIEFMSDGVVPEMGCGMAACFGGETIILFPEEAKRLRKELDGKMAGGKLIETICGTILGFSSEVADVVFYKMLWPYPYSEMDDVEGLLALVERAKSEGSFDFILPEPEDDQEDYSEYYEKDETDV